MENKKNILPSIPTGTTSLIAIFIIICISIFSVLSFVHANNDYNLSVKTQDFIKSYNKADMITENIVCEMKLTNGETTEKLKNLDREELLSMAVKARALAKRGAAQTVADTIERLAK